MMNNDVFRGSTNNSFLSYIYNDKEDVLSNETKNLTSSQKIPQVCQKAQMWKKKKDLQTIRSRRDDRRPDDKSPRQKAETKAEIQPPLEVIYFFFFFAWERVTRRVGVYFL